MKLLLVGDAHFRASTPRKRKDEDFVALCDDKLCQILRIMGEKDCDYVIQAGDLFHTPNPSYRLLNMLINRLRGYMSRFLVIHGQHDLAYHSQEAIKRSAISLLHAAGCLTPLPADGLCFPASELCLCGASFGQQPGKPKADLRCYNVLVAHTMVGNKPLWPGHSLTGPEEYVQNHPGFDLYFLGDYHYPYTVKVGDALVVNAGCLIRANASERELEHRPKVVIVDTETQETEDVYLNVSPVEEAFDLSDIKKDQEENTVDIDAFVQRLKDSGDIAVSFKDMLDVFFETNDVDDSVKQTILGNF